MQAVVVTALALSLLLSRPSSASDCDSSICRVGEYHPGSEPACRSTGCVPYCSDANSTKYDSRETPLNETNVLFVTLNGYADYGLKMYNEVKKHAAKSTYVTLTATPADLTPHPDLGL